MKKIILLASVAGVFLISSCATTNPAIVTTGAKSLKTGLVKKATWFGIGNVDVSLAQAVKEAGITKIASVDYGSKQGFLYIKNTYFVRVSGE